MALTRNIYRLSNCDLQEVHFGHTPDRIRDRLKELRRGEIPAPSHWQWGDHEIECRVIYRRVPLPAVGPIVFALKKKGYRDWKITNF